MKKIAVVLLAFISLSTANAQLKPKKDWSKVKIDQPGDHLMLQFSNDRWSGAPDSITNRMKGFSRGLNFYVMLNKPFKTDARLSVAFGVGISTSSVFFSKTNIGINTTGTILPFTNADSSSYFKKYKLATAFLEAPIELRYTFDPEHEDKSWKLAVGVKVGTMLDAHTKGKTLLNKSGTTINSYTEKQSKSTLFNSTRLVGTVRAGIGHFSIFGAYSLTTFLKDGAGPTIRPYQIGIALSGL